MFVLLRFALFRALFGGFIERACVPLSGTRRGPATAFFPACDPAAIRKEPPMRVRSQPTDFDSARVCRSSFREREKEQATSFKGFSPVWFVTIDQLYAPQVVYTLRTHRQLPYFYNVSTVTHFANVSICRTRSLEFFPSSRRFSTFSLDFLSSKSTFKIVALLLLLRC